MRRWALALMVLCGLLSACSQVTNGSGTASGAASSTPDFPSSTPSGSTAAPTSSPPTTAAPSTSTTTAPSTPSRAQRDERLLAQTNGEPHVIVAVPGGYEAATYDQSGNIQFWANPVTSVDWHQIGSSSYPDITQLGPPHASVTGAHLLGMAHATFIVRGLFTGDGSGNAVAFTAGGGAGWGAIKAESNGNIAPSGRPVGNDQIGLSFDFRFSNGNLVTADCPSNRPISDCDTHAIVKIWRWAGSEFVLR